MEHFSKVMIIGLGLMGGSLAKALRRSYHDINIIGCDVSSKTINKACFEGIINVGYCCLENQDYVSTESGIIAEISSSDIIFLCADIKTCREIMMNILPYIKEDCIITDVCSTKSELFNLFGSYGKNVCYIGGHPMTGSEKSGYDASGGYLFENAIYILSPHDNTPEDKLNLLQNVVINIGAIPYILDPCRHDVAMARISHLPHIMAAALVNTALLKESDEGTLRLLAAGGFKDITRIASGDPVLWRHIVCDNSENVCEAIDDCINILNDVRRRLEISDAEGIEKFFRDARDYRETFDSSPRTSMNLMYELSVDVEDKPGAIADITLKLRNEGINIKNIYIAESREHEGGCLRLVFDSKDARDKARKIVEG